MVTFDVDHDRSLAGLVRSPARPIYRPQLEWASDLLVEQAELRR
jgi:hypothetical protein